MLNTGLRTGELLGLLNSDIDLENRVIHLQRGVKEIVKRDGITAERGREIKVGKLKSASSKRDIPLNNTAIEMIRIYTKKDISAKIHPLCATRTAITHDLLTSARVIIEFSKLQALKLKVFTAYGTHLRPTLLMDKNSLTAQLNLLHQDKLLIYSDTQLRR